jgi:hypothetical protein
MKIGAFQDVSPCSLVGVDRRFITMNSPDDAVRTSETSVYPNETTRRYIPEGSNLHISLLFSE